ncbi:hypothetical protein OIU78_008741 [Salix suchowensis]|nr:hypothetical protein OIU78_008741 [Salix suchowensis]
MMAVMIYLFTNLPSNLKVIAALETVKRSSLRLKTLTMAVPRLLMSLLLVETQFKASDPAVDTVAAGMEVEAADAEAVVVVEATEVVEATGVEVEATEVEAEGMVAVVEVVEAGDTEGVVAVGMEAAEAAGVIAVGSQGIWQGTVHKAVEVEEVEGTVVEAAEAEEVEGVTTVAGLAILLGSVLIVGVDFRVWSGNSEKETWFLSSLCFLLICFHLFYLCFCI